MHRPGSRFVPASSAGESRTDGLVIVYYQQSFAMFDGRLLLDPDMARYLGDADLDLLLGFLDGKPCRLLRLERPVDLPGLSWHGLRGLIGQVDDDTFRMLGLAQQLDAWHDSHRFCGHCGQPMQVRVDERAMECTSCGLRQYPKLAPCIIVLITRGDEVLLARSPRFPAGFFSTLAGFIEPGESAEECLHREVMEEVNLEVDQLEYLGSQNWPFPNSLMLGFHARYVGGEIVPQPGEIEEADWWHIDRLPAIPPRGTISRWLIDCHLARQQGQPLPSVPA
ncbi:NAD(+) diphosphatase [Pseudomonas saliphila]|uniref:NAD(+) diphosphatase n=1 Tax=Pseudomonas saliphila TaxID=2586906 RepID=UPI001239807E|nr:NAD(+) diphosphatase [Pseudomonas saliphila]